MNEQELINHLLEALKSALVNPDSPLPVLAREYLTQLWIHSLIGILFGIVAVFAGLHIMIRLASISDDEPQDGLRESVSAIGFVLIVVGLVVGILNVDPFVQTTFAPRTVLLEKAEELIGLKD